MSKLLVTYGTKVEKVIIDVDYDEHLPPIVSSQLGKSKQRPNIVVATTPAPKKASSDVKNTQNISMMLETPNDSPLSQHVPNLVQQHMVPTWVGVMLEDISMLNIRNTRFCVQICHATYVFVLVKE